jgi:site-specific recombinase XerD
MEGSTMARPRSQKKFNIFKLSSSPYWHVWFFSDEKGKVVRRSTGYLCEKFSSEYVQRIFDSETGTKNVAKHSVDWLEDHSSSMLELEGRSESTIELNKLAFRHLRSLYEGGQDIRKIDRSIVPRFQEHLHNKGIGNSGINLYLRHLRAAFERCINEDILEKNPFRRFKQLQVPKKKMHMTFQEAKHFINVVNLSKHQDAKHLTRILFYTGIRRGEVLSIKRENVNLCEGFYRTINIKSRDKHLVYREIPSEIIPDFEHFMNKSPQFKYPFKVCVPDRLSQLVKGFLREAGLSEDLHCHSLRHTFITLGLEQKNATIREMQTYLDHSSISITEGYAHDRTVRSPILKLE